MSALEPLTEQLRTFWRRPRSFTSLVPVNTSELGEVHARLAALAPKLRSAVSSVEDLHTLRIVAAPPQSPNGSVRVLLNCVHDRPLDEHLDALIRAAGEWLALAFTGADFSGVPGELPELLLRFRKSDNTFHLGAINHSVKEILAEQRLLEAIETFVDVQLQGGLWNSATPAETIRRQIRDHVLAQPATANLPRGLANDISWEGKLLRFLDLLATFAMPSIGVLAPHIQKAIRRIENPIVRTVTWFGYGLWWLYGGLFTGGALLFVRMLEKFEPDIVAPPPDPEKVKRIEAKEDLQLTNNVTYWFPVRPTLTRRWLLRVILWGSERGCRHFWTVGALADIETIHYARILEVDEGRTMVFLSDYDGSLDRYLIDFLGVGSSAVIPIASNVSGCPKTRWLFYPEDPSVFGPRLGSLLRLNQLETPVWFSMYPNLSVRDILSNSLVRQGLFTPVMSESEASGWLARL